MCYFCDTYTAYLNDLGSLSRFAQAESPQAEPARSLSSSLSSLNSAQAINQADDDQIASRTVSDERDRFIKAAPKIDQSLSKTLTNIQKVVAKFATSSDFLEKMTTVYGDNFDSAAALKLADDWKQKDFSVFPKIEFRSLAEMNGSKGAYELETQTIYLATEYFELYRNHISTLTDLVLEEFGHHLDTVLNGTTDSMGDEGAIFSALVQQRTLSESELQILQAEDDQTVITLDGQLAQVEKSHDDSSISFVEVTATAGNFTSGRSYGAGAWTDFNQDGLPDLWVNNHFGVTENGSERNLYLNNGDGTFTDVVSEVFADPQSLTGDFHGTAWADFDNDGDPDLIQVVGGEGNTTTLGEENLPPQSGPNRLFVNEGGILVEKAREFGLSYDSAKAQMPIWLDFDNDGALDLFHGATQRADGLTPATVFRQTSNGFVDQGAVLLPTDVQGKDIKFGALASLSGSIVATDLSLVFPGVAAAIVDTDTEPFENATNSYVNAALLNGAKDIAVDDFNGDLLMDIYLTRNGQDRLLLNTAQGFVDFSQNSGINNVLNAGAGGVVSGDFDNDMDVDLYVIRTADSTGNRPNLLYENQGDATFTAIPLAGGAAGITTASGDNATTADYDLDGFLDLFVTNGTGSSVGSQQLFRNQGNSHHWVQIDLEGVISNRDGIGAQVFVTAGGLTQRQDQMGGGHKRSQDHTRLHFGLDQNTQIDRIEIYWPSGSIQTLENVAADQILQIVEEDNSEGTPQPAAWFSFINTVTLDGVSLTAQDIAGFDGSRFSQFFDGSDVGLEGQRARITALDIISDNEILMSFSQPVTLPGVGLVDDSDVVKFTATSLGETTAGSFELYLDGSDVGLNVNAQGIDALTGLPDGSLLISTRGPNRLLDLTGQDEDLLLFSPTSLGEDTAGAWSFYFDGSEVGLADGGGEDIDAVSIGEAGELIFSTAGDFNVTDLSGADEDAFVFRASSTGSTTSGSFDPALLFDGSAFELTANDISSADFAIG